MRIAVQTPEFEGAFRKSRSWERRHGTECSRIDAASDVMSGGKGRCQNCVTVEGGNMAFVIEAKPRRW